MVWHRIAIEDKQVSHVKTAFESLFEAAGSPPRAGIFLSIDTIGETVEVYFSPEAYSIANILVIRHHGSPCPRPSAALFFLAGSREQPSPPAA